jgi:hypothetical protein
MSYCSIALGGYEDQLIVPGVGIERPAVAEDDGLARAPVIVIDLWYRPLW